VFNFKRKYAQDSLFLGWGGALPADLHRHGFHSWESSFLESSAVVAVTTNTSQASQAY